MSEKAQSIQEVLDGRRVTSVSLILISAERTRRHLVAKLCLPSPDAEKRCRAQTRQPEIITLLRWAVL